MRRLLPTSFDSFVRESTPSTNFRDEKFLAMRTDTGQERRAFLHFSLPDLRGATITSATLLLTLKDAWSGSNTVTVRRVTEAWKEGGITWNNAPASTATNASTGVVTGGIDGQVLPIDVEGIVQDWANSPRQVFGVRLTCSNAALRRIYASEAVRRQVRPQLAIEWAVPPDEPVNLRPNGEGQAISEAAPLLLWDSDQPFETQVQIDNSEDFSGSITYDSGWVANSEMAFDTALAAVPPNLANNTTWWWRVRIRDAAGVASEWSDAAEFDRRTKGSLSVTSPGSGIDVQTTTPVIEHSFTGRTQQEIEYQLFEDGLLIYTNRRFPSTETELELPQGLITSDTAVYTVTIRVWDTFHRRTIGDDFAYAEASREFQFAPVAGVDPVDDFVVADDGGHVLMTWTRNPAPDYYALRVDGRLVFDRLDPDELLISGDAYGLSYFRAAPRESAVYRIEAIENDSGVLKHSTSNPEEAHTFSPLGIWLADETTSTEVHILGDDDVGATLGESGGVFYPLGSRVPVHVVDGRRGYEGGVSGTLIEFGGVTATEWRERLEDIYGRSDPSLRLVHAWRNWPVAISELALPASPIPEQAYTVAFSYEQTGEFTVSGVGPTDIVVPLPPPPPPVADVFTRSVSLAATAAISVAGQVFSPLGIPGLVAWFDFNDATKLFTDAGTTPVTTDGDAIYQVNDKVSGAGNGVAQTNAANRPTWQTGEQGGRGIGRFDATDILTASATTAAAVPNGDDPSFTVIAVGKTPAVPDNSAAVGWGSAATASRITARISLVGTPVMAVGWRNDASVTITDATAVSLTLAANSWHVFTWVKSAATVLFYLDGTPATENPVAHDAGPSTANRMGVGGMYTNGGENPTWNSDLGEVFIFSNAIAASYHNELGRFLQTRWSTPTWTTVT